MLSGPLRQTAATGCAAAAETSPTDVHSHARPAGYLVNSPAVRITFSSLASQSVGPPLSDFEMSFAGRNWPKIGKKLLQAGVTPLANQLVATDDSRLGPFSNQGGATCAALGRPTAVGKPGLCITYPELIRTAFVRTFWHNNGGRLNGAPCSTHFVRTAISSAGSFDFGGIWYSSP